MPFASNVLGAVTVALAVAGSNASAGPYRVILHYLWVECAYACVIIITSYACVHSAGVCHVRGHLLLMRLSQKPCVMHACMHARLHFLWSAQCMCMSSASNPHNIQGADSSVHAEVFESHAKCTVHALASTEKQLGEQTANAGAQPPCFP